MKKLLALLVLLNLLTPIYSQDKEIDVKVSPKEYKIAQLSKDFDIPRPNEKEKQNAWELYNAEISEWDYNNYITIQDKIRINSFASQNYATVSGLNPLGNRRYSVTYLTMGGSFVKEVKDFSDYRMISFEDFKLVEKKIRFANYKRTRSEFSNKFKEYEDKLLELGKKRDEAVLKYRKDISLNWIEKFASLIGSGEYIYLNEDVWDKRIIEGIDDSKLRIVYKLNNAFLENENIIFDKNEDVEKISIVSVYIGLVPIIEKIRITVSNLFTTSPCSYNYQNEYEYLDLNSVKYFIEGRQFSKECSPGMRNTRDNRYIRYLNSLNSYEKRENLEVKYLGNTEGDDLKYYLPDDYKQTQNWFNNLIEENKEINFASWYPLSSSNYKINVQSDLKLNTIKGPGGYSEGYNFPEREYIAASLKVPSISIKRYHFNSIQYNVGIYKSFVKATESLPEKIKSKIKPALEAIYNPKSNISVWCKHPTNSRTQSYNCPEWKDIVNDYYKNYDLAEFPKLVLNTEWLKFNPVTNIGAFEVNGFGESHTYIYRFQLLNDLLILERLSAYQNNSYAYTEYGTVSNPLNNCSGETIKRNDGKILCYTQRLEGLFTICNDKNYYNSSWGGGSTPYKLSNGDIPKKIFKATSKALKKRKKRKK